MIQKFGQMYYPQCDICGSDLDGVKGFGDFYDAVNSKKANGWKAQKRGDEWIDVCVECQERGALK